MSAGFWDQYLWVVMQGFQLCLSVIVIVAGVIALRVRARLPGTLLLAGGILLCLGLGGAMAIGVYFRANSFVMDDPAKWETYQQWSTIVYAVGMLGSLLEVCGLLLAVLALRAFWRRRAEWGSLPSEVTRRAVPELAGPQE